MKELRLYTERHTDFLSCLIKMAQRALKGFAADQLPFIAAHLPCALYSRLSEHCNCAENQIISHKHIRAETRNNAPAF